jgi:glycosyltransferase involved in cell wall biosynthesis
MQASPGKLRVVHIITQLELGGAQRNTLYTVGHLNPELFEPFLIAGPGGILDSEAKAGPWRTRFVSSLVRPVRPWKDVLALISIYRFLQKIKPHIVHTHSSKAGILGRIAAFFAGVPVVIHTFHGFGFTPGQRPFVRRFFIWTEKISAWFSTHHIFVSEANRQEAAELHIGPKTSNSLIRSGIAIDAPIHRATSVTEQRTKDKVLRVLKEIPSDACRVTYVGNFKPQKNPMDLARVACEVLKQKQNIHFFLVGEGELQASVEAWCQEQGIASQVHFLGWCKRYDDIQRILAASTCFLLTSLWEGLPRALVEAFASSKPAVAYGVDGVRDILRDGENGFLIPPGDVTLAAEKILWLANNPDKAIKMGQRGRAMVIKEFDIDFMVRQQENLYQTLYQAVPLKTYYESLWNNPT